MDISDIISCFCFPNEIILYLSEWLGQADNNANISNHSIKALLQVCSTDFMQCLHLVYAFQWFSFVCIFYYTCNSNKKYPINVQLEVYFIL